MENQECETRKFGVMTLIGMIASGILGYSIRYDNISGTYERKLNEQKQRIYLKFLEDRHRFLDESRMYLEFKERHSDDTHDEKILREFDYLDSLEDIITENINEGSDESKKSSTQNIIKPKSYLN
ncbi:hypothetical protein J4221_00625 [Candidatus Pacearchaeota archaeon]|nr:hypothetical protein [Candidatus Pacearchaeota archaeon]